MDSYYHYLSTQRWNHLPQALELHQWLDASKVSNAHYKHRIARHHADIIKDTNELYSSEYAPIVQQHIHEDLGFLATLDDWVTHLSKPIWFRQASLEQLCMLSADKFKGQPEDYLEFHRWVLRYQDTNPLRNVVTHHTLAIPVALQILGPTIQVSRGIRVPTISLYEYHLMVTYGFLPTLSDWVRTLKPKEWMYPTSKLLFGRAKRLYQSTTSVK